ncbi:MAG: type II secretion system minor pseudopilin GspI [Maricaulaceae bacterium]
MAARRGAAPQAGFTLLEVMVALAVFSLAAVTLLQAGGQNARLARVLQERALAQIVAENRLVESLALETPPDLGVDRGIEPQGAFNWAWMRTVAPTPDPALVRVDVEVRLSQGPGVEPGPVLTNLTAFREVES